MTRINPDTGYDESLDDFPSSAAHIAYFYQTEGPEALPLLMAQLLAEGIFSRENFERDAAELEIMELSEIAEIVAEFIPDAVPERELLCPYKPDDRCNYESWQASYDRRKTNQGSNQPHEMLSKD
jgi:hypothetical protein